MTTLSSEKSKYKWIYRDTEEPSEEFLSICGSKIVARLLMNRGIKSVEQVGKFLSPEKILLSSPNYFPDMEKAVERINKAIEAGEHILIYGDFDADGVTSTSLLLKVFRFLGANVSYYIPDRSEEGHGLNTAAVLKLVSARQAKVIITVDCGISNSSEVKLVNNFKADVIITDHHDAPDEIPPAFAIINPKILETPNDLAYLAGVGVAYKLAQAVLETHNKSEYLEEVLFLVVLGSIADVVPLLGENRAFLTKGLQLISRKPPLCLKKLLDSAGYKLDNGFSAEMMSFGVAPRINAAGRLEKADLAVDFLTSEDEEEIDNLVKKLNYCNRNRQQICENTFLEAEMKLKREIDLNKDRAIVLGDNNWHPGVIGIVASKLIEKYGRPCFLVSINSDKSEASCSARGIKGVHLQRIFTDVSDMFERYGGHALAAGCMFDLTKHSFESFRKKITEIVNSKFKEEFLLPPLSVDTELLPDDISEKTIKEIERLEPFGEGNSSPVFTMSSLKVVNYKTIGQANNHLKIFLQDENQKIYDAIWWQTSSLPFQPGDCVKIAFCLKLNNFGGKNYIQLEIKDIASDGNESSAEKKEEISVKKEEAIKWIDHRKKIEPARFFSEYVKSSGEQFVVFAETPETRAICENDKELKHITFDRSNMKKANNLLMLDMPPDMAIFSRVIKNSDPTVIHMAAKTSPLLEPIELLKKVSGMLKFVYANKNGEISPESICSKLGISSRIFLALIKTLESAEIIKVKFLANDSFKFDYLGSTDAQKITSSQEFAELSSLLNVAKDFYKKFSSANISAIKDSIEKMNTDFVRS
ncbi:MAG: single-stranded-DNA-specific exonuclease RecJ [bacterium]